MLTFKLPDEATVFQAGVDGIKTGCESFFDNPSHKPKYIKIISDSQAALFALHSNTFTSSTALSTAEAVSNLAWIANKVTLAWTRTHVGTVGNEAADIAARQGANNNGNVTEVPLPLTARWNANLLSSTSSGVEGGQEQ